MIRPATLTDSEAFHALSKAYIAESGQRREYSEERTQEAFTHAVGDPFTLLLVAEAPQGFAGGVLAQLDHAFTLNPICIVSMLYVMPAYRGTGLSRALMQGAVSWADSANCTHTFCSATAMLDDIDTQLFINLCNKFGFRPAGSPVLARSKPCQQ